MTLGVGKYGLRVTEMATALGVRYNSACLWSRRGATRSRDDRGLAGRLDEVDAIVASTPADTTELVIEVWVNVKTWNGFWHGFRRSTDNDSRWISRASPKRKTGG